MVPGGTFQAREREASPKTDAERWQNCCQPRPSVLFGSLKCLLKCLLFITITVLFEQIIQEALLNPTFGSHHEKDFDICRKRYVWKRPIAGDDADWHPFLTSHDVFWKGDVSKGNKMEVLLHHTLPFGLKYSGRLAFEALKLLPPQEMPQPIASLHCKKCVVVGNSRKLLGRRLGKFIDSHNVIMRLNNAPLKHYEEDVGERTTIRFFYPEMALAKPLENSDKDTFFFLIPFKKMDFLWVKAVLQKDENLLGIWSKDPTEWNASHLRIVNPFVTYQTHYKLLQLTKDSQAYPSMGFIALNFALHLCQEVNIVGFGYPASDDLVTPVHYYDIQPRHDKELKEHNITLEQKQLQKLHQWEVISDALAPPTWVWGPRTQW